ncbi:MAG: serine protease [Pirellulales bacterium]
MPKRQPHVYRWLLPCLLATLLLTPTFSIARADESILRTALWPFSAPRHRAIYDSGGGPVTPHPAVARIIVPEGDSTAYGTGTLVGVREDRALVVTNWHVVHDSRGVVEVVFPNGFRSHAKPLKVDSDWDLAALVIWRPPVDPVKLSAEPPRPGDPLTIHGYGQGQYRIATGRCTSYYAPHAHFPLEMVELDVEARQGDSGGPIFNQRGELAGVLFGAGEGTTLGSFGPRVSTFLASVAPDIGRQTEQPQIAIADRPAPIVRPAPDKGWTTAKPEYPSSPWSPKNANQNQIANAQAAATNEALAWSDVTANSWYDPVKSALAVVGLVAVVLQLVKFVR